MLNKHWLSRIWRKAPLWQLEDPRTWIDVSCEFTAFAQQTETLHVMLGTHKVIISHTGHWTLVTSSCSEDIWKSYSSDLRTEFPLPCKVQLAEDRRSWWCWDIRGGSGWRAAEEARRPTSWAAVASWAAFTAGANYFTGTIVITGAEIAKMRSVAWLWFWKVVGVEIFWS